MPLVPVYVGRKLAEPDLLRFPKGSKLKVCDQTDPQLPLVILVRSS